LFQNPMVLSAGTASYWTVTAIKTIYHVTCSQDSKSSSRLWHEKMIPTRLNSSIAKGFVLTKLSLAISVFYLQN